MVSYGPTSSDLAVREPSAFSMKVWLNRPRPPVASQLTSHGEPFTRTSRKLPSNLGFVGLEAQPRNSPEARRANTIWCCAWPPPSADSDLGMVASRETGVRLGRNQTIARPPSRGLFRTWAIFNGLIRPGNDGWRHDETDRPPSPPAHRLVVANR